MEGGDADGMGLGSLSRKRERVCVSREQRPCVESDVYRKRECKMRAEGLSCRTGSLRFSALGVGGGRDVARRSNSRCPLHFSVKASTLLPQIDCPTQGPAPSPLPRPPLIRSRPAQALCFERIEPPETTSAHTRPAAGRGRAGWRRLRASGCLLLVCEASVVVRRAVLLWRWLRTSPDPGTTAAQDEERLSFSVLLPETSCHAGFD